MNVLGRPRRSESRDSAGGSGPRRSTRARGPSPELRPLPGLPILESRGGDGAGTALLIADLHLGLGADKATVTPAVDSARQMAEEILDAAHRTAARRIVIAGDSQHPIVGAPATLRRLIFDFFADLLASGVTVEVVPGNHDVGLVPLLPREVVTHPATGTIDAGVGVFHGHCWPSSDVLACDRLVVGHLHPGFRFAPTTEESAPKRRCWVRVRFGAGPSPTNGRAMRARELIVLPAFHPLAGTEALNKDRPQRGRSFLFQRFLLRGECRAYLMDGTDLGLLPFTAKRPDLPKPAARGSRRGPRPERGSGSRSR